MTSRSCPVRGRRTPCLRAAEHTPEYEYDDVEYADVTLVDLHGRPLPEPPEPSSLSDAALIELFTVAGTSAGAGAALCLRAGGLRAALQLNDDELQREGFDAARLRAAVEIGTRYTSAAIERGEPLTSPATTKAALLARLRERPHEIFACLFLDNRHRVLAFEELFRGTIDGARASIRARSPNGRWSSMRRPSLRHTITRAAWPNRVVQTARSRTGCATHSRWWRYDCSIIS